MFGSSQVRFTARTMYAYLKTLTDILNYSSPLKEKIAPFCLNNLLPELFSYFLLPNFLVSEKYNFLEYSAASNVKFLQRFETNQTVLTSSFKHKDTDRL